MNLRLFYAPITCSMVPYINLEEANARFTVQPVNFKSGEQTKAEFKKLNPKGKVPTLVIDDIALTENVAISAWIAKTFPDARLLPDNFIDEMEALSLLSWFASGIHPFLSPNMVPQRFCSVEGTSENVKECAQNSLANSFAIADQRLSKSDWFFDHFTVTDAYFFWTFLRATRFDFKYLDLTQFKNCQAHMARMKERSSVKKLLAFEKQTIASFESSPPP